MQIYNIVRKNTYFDSVTLMLISKQLKQLEGIDDVSVMMGTPANRQILQEAGLLNPDGESAGSNDLIMAFRAPADIDSKAVCLKIEQQLANKTTKDDKNEVASVRSVHKAFQDNPDSNLVFISVPGEYAVVEAHRALKHGKNVFLFSDNVSLAEEAGLKEAAAEKGLMVMGPDCGTAIINGVGIGFANKVRRGNIGIVAASGTGLQEVTCLLDAMGLGISQAIGTGGRDLKEAIGAVTMLQALDFLLTDPETQTIMLVSKPPAKPVVDLILKKLDETDKKAILCFIGYNAASPSDEIVTVSTLEEACLQAASLNRIEPQLLTAEAELDDWARQAAKSLKPEQRFVRALYAGGTLCYEAMLVLGKDLGPVYSNIPLASECKIKDVMAPGRHSAIDLGDDEFTKGRPHPMIDGSLRNEYIVKVAAHPETAVLLLDVVIGFGASEDPAGELVPVLASAREAAKAAGNQLVVVAYVCGTNSDSQHKDSQAQKLRDAGVLVTRTNAEAARLAGRIARGQGVDANVSK